MDPKIIKKTQDTLGTIIKKPPLTEKLLGKPPFRFLHDVMTSVIKTTGFMHGLYSDAEMNSENVKDKDAKLAFLQKSIDMVCAVTGKSLTVKPVKVVAGHEPEKTNEFLQCLATAINKGVNSDDFVRQVLKGSGGGSAKEEKKESHREKDKEKDREKEKDRDRTKSADRRKSRDSEDRHKERNRDREDKERSKDRSRDKGEKDSEKDRERRHDKDRHKDRESKTRDKSRDGREDRHKEKSSRKSEHKEKENESPEREKVNGEKGEKQEAPSRLQRPSSAKGSRRRREAQNHTATEDEEFQKSVAPSSDAVMGEGDLPPQVAAARQLGRPSSARPAPPRPKQDVLESEPAMRLGTGQPTNVIVDNDNDDDEDDNFLVEETASAPLPEPDLTPSKPSEEEDAEHGALVKKMLESKKELEGGNQTKKTEIERPVMSDAQRRKQREQVQKEVDRLRTSIQSLTRSANPLGKVMDYVQEDLDAMQQELDKWRAENAQHALDLRREMNVTDRAIEPLRQQLTELDTAIQDQLGQIAATKSSIIRNDQKMHKMLRGISGS